MNDTKIPVIYILGSGHSGSTLLDLIIGSHSEAESTGEISNLRSFVDPFSGREDKRCTCGLPFAECQFWTDVNHMVDLNSLGNIDDTDPFSFEEKNVALIKAILNVSNKTVFCDSSKSIARLENYLKSKRFRVQIVHLVRDGRAVAYSQLSKKKRLLDRFKNRHDYKKWLKEHNKNEKQYSFLAALHTWGLNNEACIKKFSQNLRYMLVRYEDLVAAPEYEVQRILNAVDLDIEGAQFDFFAKEHHNISGNRMRRSGNPEIKRDIRYIQGLSLGEWWISTLYLIRMLRRFGYPVIRK